jgi:hypothetical protein
MRRPSKSAVGTWFAMNFKSDDGRQEHAAADPAKDRPRQRFNKVGDWFFLVIPRRIARLLLATPVVHRRNHFLLPSPLMHFA